MRFLTIAPNTTILKPIADNIFAELESLNHETELITMRNFYFDCSYLMRKLYKFGIKSYERKYDQKLLAEFTEHCNRFRPDFVLVLNAWNVPPIVQEFMSNYKTVLWLWDSVNHSPLLEKFADTVDEVFCFEYDDISRLVCNGKIHYLPLCANDRVYYPADRERDIDISFVGMASKLRLDTLEKVCERAIRNGWTVKLGGILYNDKHFWKEYLFKHKYPHLAKFVDNRIFAPEEVAELYRRSKICLNINTVKHRSLSPRTFEICATKSFQLMNAGQESHGLMNLDTDLVTYNDIDDLLSKIEYYLDNENLREQIAQAGYNSVMKNCTLKKSVERLFAESQVIRQIREGKS